MSGLRIRGLAVLAVLAVVAAAGAWADDLPKGQARTEINIEGMTCGGCCTKVETALAELEGVVAAKADYKAGKAMVTYVEKEVSVDQIVATINEKTSFKAKAPQKKSA